jgi:hypothetical protein
MKLGGLFLSPVCLLVAGSFGGSISLAQQLLVALPVDGPPPLADLDPGASVQPITTFNNAVPNNAVENDQSAITLGFKFRSGTAGSISAISFYRGTSSSQGYVASLYSATGTELASVYMPQETDPVPGWQVAQFASPVSISANPTYAAAYYAPSGQYADQYNGLSQGAPLNVPAAATVGGMANIAMAKRSQKPLPTTIITILMSYSRLLPHAVTYLYASTHPILGSAPMLHWEL